MTKLSDIQLVILTAACQRTNQLALPLPEHLRGGAAKKVIGALVAKGLLAEVAAGRDDPVWRENADGQGVTLAATEAALEALGIEPADGPTGGSTVATASDESPTPARRRSRQRAAQRHRKVGSARGRNRRGWSPC